MSPGTATVVIRPDVDAFLAVIGQARRSITDIYQGVARSIRKASRALTMMSRAWETEERRQVREAGLEARYYVRGGLAPEYADPAARDAYARALCRELDGPLKATAFLLGWTACRSGVR